MKEKNGTQNRDLRKRGEGAIKRDIVIFTFFLLLSFLFWYLNSLGKEFEAGITLPVKFINIPKERTIALGEVPRLNLFLKGPGYSIIKLKFAGNSYPVIFDISKINYKRVSGSKNLDYYIVMSGLTKSLTVQLRIGCEITSIKPDTLFFTLNKVDDKPTPVYPDNNSARNRLR